MFQEMGGTDTQSARLPRRGLAVASSSMCYWCMPSCFCWCASRGRRSGVGSVALFDVHPLQAETVSWVMNGINDLLSGCLSLLALWQYLVYSIKNGADPSPMQGQMAATLCHGIRDLLRAGVVRQAGNRIDPVVRRTAIDIPSTAPPVAQQRAMRHAALETGRRRCAWIPVTRSAMVAPQPGERRDAVVVASARRRRRRWPSTSASWSGRRGSVSIMAARRPGAEPSLGLFHLDGAAVVLAVVAWGKAADQPGCGRQRRQR